MSTQTWTVAEAKAKFSELIDKAKSEGPRKITKHGRITFHRESTSRALSRLRSFSSAATRSGKVSDFFGMRLTEYVKTDL